MDTRTYATVTDLCARMAGRLPDDTLDTIRVHYFAGEPGLAEATLLLSLAHQHTGITAEERELLRTTLEDPADPDLAAVPAVDSVPLRYRFTTAPADAPDLTRPDGILAEAAGRHGARWLGRAWREPLAGAVNGAGWVYVLRVSAGAEVLRAYSGLSSTLSVSLRTWWPVEVVADEPLPAYQAAALAAARQVWAAETPSG